MKKIIYLSFLFFMIIFTCNTNFKADNNNPNYSSDYINTYYQNLYSNYLSNESNTLCGYQAFCSLLSYWDNYWDETFIPTQYDNKALVDGHGFYWYDHVNSPGINRINLPMTYSGDTYVYDFTGLNIINSNEFTVEQKIALLAAMTNYNSNYSLFGKLLHLIDNNTSSFGREQLNTFYLSGMAADEAFDLYDSYFDYLNLNTSFNLNNYTINSVSGMAISGNQTTVTDLTDQVVDYIEDGYPVLCLLAPLTPGTYSGVEFNGHFIVCYEYDDVSGDIYGHTDYYVNNNLITNSHYNISTYNEDMSIAGYYVITPNNSNSHVCTWAYMNLSDFDDVKHYCPCQIEYHLSSHSSIFSHTQNEHYCTNSECGFHEQHFGTYEEKNRYSHFTTCSVCNQVFIMQHEFEVHAGVYKCRQCNYEESGGDIIIYKKEEEELI